MSNKLLKSLKVLFIEDEDLIRNKIVSSLDYIVAEVISASNGIEALEKLQNFTPDLIITDLEMPKMNGADFIHEVRKKIKILVL